MNAAVLLNAGAGSHDEAKTREETARVAGALSGAGVEGEVRRVEPEHLAGLVGDAAGSGVDVVVVGGGDGTLSTAAGELAGSDTPLGILPLGTLNHFAKDLRIPLELGAAARVIAAGHARKVDVGEVNGRVFINNSSIGLYPLMVEDRDEQREDRGRSKWLAMALAGAGAIRRFPLWRVHLTADGRTLPRTTPFVFVGNNEYEESVLGMRGRSSLDRGELSLYVPRTTSRAGMLWLALQGLAGRLDEAEDFEAMRVHTLDVETKRRSVRVAVDGEVTRMRPPLRYRVRPRSLRVLVPAPESA